MGNGTGGTRTALLTRFYAELLEWPIVHEEPGRAVVAPPQGSFPPRGHPRRSPEDFDLAVLSALKVL
ncbi:hypothetical protein ACIRBZ_42800 [Streptomyces sp. NPDC094038]|uniref:hypothetical protein n=1 Tax=Streptomyces sp. NPDC094038 TaxID=3366055 RepID=UPI003818AF59